MSSHFDQIRNVHPCGKNETVQRYMNEQKEKKEKIVREREEEKQKKEEKEKQLRIDKMNKLFKYMVNEMNRNIKKLGNEDWLVFDETDEILRTAPYELKQGLNERDIDHVQETVNTKFGAR